MDRAHIRNGLLSQKFWFKTNNLKSKDYKKNTLEQTNFLRSHQNTDKREEDIYHELYIHEILAGREDLNFKGILPLI